MKAVRLITRRPGWLPTRTAVAPVADAGAVVAAERLAVADLARMARQ